MEHTFAYAEILECPNWHDDLRGLKSKLEERGIKVGKLIDVGTYALLFEIEAGKGGDTLDSAILRIEPTDIVGTLDSPATIQPVMTIDSGYFKATVVPRAEKYKYDIKNPSDLAELKKTFAVLNAENHLLSIKDIAGKLESTFMKLPGIDIPVIVDLGALPGIKHEAKSSQGTINEFIEQHNLGNDILENKVSDAELARLRAKYEKLMCSVRQDLSKKGVRLNEGGATPNDTWVESTVNRDSPKRSFP